MDTLGKKAVLTGCALLLLMLQRTVKTQNTVPFERSLLDRLTADYSPITRPKLNSTAPIDVTLRLNLLSIEDFDEEKEEITLNTLITLTWTDEFLRWEPKVQGNVKHITLPKSNIWVPRFVIANSVKDAYPQDLYNDPLMRVSSVGLVTMQNVYDITVKCDVNLKYFPYDEQKCSIVIESWFYTAEQVLLKAPVTSSQLMDRFTSSSVWDLKDISIQSKAFTDGDSQFNRITVTLLISRKPTDYIITIIVPCIVLSLLAVSQFLVPGNGDDRVSLGIGVIVANVLYLLLYAQATPTNGSSDISYVVLYVIAQLCLNTLMVLISTLVVRVHKNLTTKLPPSCLRKWAKACAECTRTKDYEDPPYATFLQERPSIYQQQGIPSRWNFDNEGIANPVGTFAPSAPPSYQMEAGPRGPVPGTTQGFMLGDPGYNIGDQQTLPLEGRVPPQVQAQQQLQAQQQGKSPIYSHLEILLSRQLQLIRGVTDKIHDMRQQEVMKEQWHMIGRTVDCVFFWIFLIASVVLVVLLILVMPDLKPALEI